MKHAVFAATLLITMAFAFAASAQGAFDLNQPGVGKEAGTFMLRGRAIGVWPLNADSSVSTLGGEVTANAQAAPEADLSYFITDNIAVELIAATTRHEVAAKNTSLGQVDVGSVWVLPPTLTLQYHFLPKSAFSPYVGAGINGTIFYDTHPARPTVTHVSFDSNVGAAIQAGFDYNIGGHWFANFDMKQIFLSTTAHLTTALGSVTAKTDLDPLVVGAGIGYRF